MCSPQPSTRVSCWLDFTVRAEDFCSNAFTIRVPLTGVVDKMDAF